MMKTKQKWIFLFLVVVMMITLIGVTYAVFSKTLSGNKKYILRFSDLELQFDESKTNGNIVLEDMIPMKEEEGKNNPTYRFSLLNLGNHEMEYTIYIVEDTKTNKTPSQFIKYHYTRDYKNLDITRGITEQIEDDGRYYLEKDYIQKKTTYNYEFQMWLDYNAENDVMGTEYSIHLEIDSGYDESFEFEKEITYSGHEEEVEIPMSGYYMIELWGASGGDIDEYKGGRGAYTRGSIYLERGTKLYFHVGGEGTNTDVGGYNGGGSLREKASLYGSSGGGATDVRLEPGSWDNFEGLKSRIMVAAGGGGANNRNRGDKSYMYGAGNGGAGGELEGLDGESVHYQDENDILSYNEHAIGTGGTQTSGGIQVVYDKNNTIKSRSTTGGFATEIAHGQTGSGAGYYSGGNSGHGGAGGGSSFISGYPGCDAIKETSTEDKIEHTGSAIHYSGKVFVSSLMIAGNKEMPNKDGTGTTIGNTGNGHARISYQKLSLTNIIKNGGFEEEKTDVTTGNNNCCSQERTTEQKYQGDYSLRGNYSNKVTITGARETMIMSATTLRKGHVYYASEMFLNNTIYPSNYWRGDFDLFLYGGTATGYPEYVNIAINEIQEQGVWYHLSDIFTSTVDAPYNFRLGYFWPTTTETLNLELYYDNLLLIDLTESFGTGKEPSKEWCDKNIKWFDGNTRISYDYESF